MERANSITYKIADVYFRIDTPWKPQQTEAFLPFCSEEKKFHWNIRFEAAEQLENLQEALVFSDDIFSIYKDKDGNYVRQYHNNRPDGSPYASVRTDGEAKEVTVKYLPESIGMFGTCKKDFFLIGLERLLIEENALILHAACADTPYGGLLFTGMSGAGKSTQADLWCQYGQGRLINGDRPVIKETSEGWMAYGSPYAGSSGCHLQESCSIRAIVIPKKAKICEIRQLHGAEMFRQVYQNITINSWDREFVSKAGTLTAQLLQCVPVYELRCTKEKEAVECLQDLLEKERETWI